MTLISKASHTSINTYFYFHNQPCAIKGTGSIPAGALEPCPWGVRGTGMCQPGGAAWLWGQNLGRRGQSLATLVPPRHTRKPLLGRTTSSGPTQSRASTAETKARQATLQHKGSTQSCPHSAPPKEIWYMSYTSATSFLWLMPQS